MQKYPAYKDSTAPWFGDVPESWDMIRLGAILRERGEKNDGTKTENVLSVLKDIGVINYEDKGDIGNKKSEDIERYKIVHEGDLVLNSMNVIIGSVGMSPEYGALSPVYYVLRAADDSVYMPYYDYVFKIRPFQDSLKRIGYGILDHRMRIPMTLLKKEPLPKPPLKEQKAIVAFLDEQTAVINQFLTNKKRLIELLEEQKQVVINTAVTQGLETAVGRKPSGIEWLGDIPAHWECLQIKRCLQKYEYGISASLSGSGRYKVLTMGHIQDGQVIIPDEGCLEEKPDLILDNGDLLFNRTNSPELVGKVGLFRGNASDEISFASYLVRLKPREDVVPEYLNYLLNSSTFINSARQNALVSLHQANLNPTKYSRMLIPMPSHDEQLKIVKFIDDKTAEINAAIERTQREIELIEEYRTTLIAHAVTGKIDVRSVV